jgi:flagellar biogenesis protein FliO
MRIHSPDFNRQIKGMFWPAGLVLLTMLVAGTARAQQTESPEPAVYGLIKELTSPNNDARTSADQLIENALSAETTQQTTGNRITAWMASVNPSTRRSIAIGVLAGSLSLLALFLLRQSPSRRRGVLPEDVVSLLGQIPFGPGQKLQLVRLGSKLLLVTTTPAGSHTLGEISDPEEVMQIETLCRSGRYDAIGATLRNRIRTDSRDSLNRDSARNRAVFEA